MSRTHTPGKLQMLQCSTCEFEIRGPDGSGVTLARTTPWGIAADAPDPSLANARRLVACWNAFDGVPTDDIEASARIGVIDPQPLVDALAKTETYLLERLASNPGSTGATVILPMIRRAIEGAGVAPTQSTWGDFPAT